MPAARAAGKQMHEAPGRVAEEATLALHGHERAGRDQTVLLTGDRRRPVTGLDRAGCERRSRDQERTEHRGTAQTITTTADPAMRECRCHARVVTRSVCRLRLVSSVSRCIRRCPGIGRGARRGGPWLQEPRRMMGKATVSTDRFAVRFPSMPSCSTMMEPGRTRSRMRRATTRPLWSRSRWPTCPTPIMVMCFRARSYDMKGVCSPWEVGRRWGTRRAGV